ncbi:hypothetical protein BZA05DRAFT_212496 [Tricharina praecox]|uniref:uncharacterized protein n=1 Tax=Tricharina praecox TaxID=43433 RepID=UPI00221E5A5C|nr:uncharacterized protein BZA05DRAFT_212496 [Tricharina praecox]KAI5841589.1 hypothetical protein BZA05DRAFT_212496 [Tricharina praecox]
MHSFQSLIAFIVLLSLILTSTTHASAIPAPTPRNTLVPRQLISTSAASNTCQDSGSTACNITGASFCCPAQTECIPLENNTAVICCNVDEICAEIHPIACPAVQDSAKPQPTCGSECCPFGFECDPAGNKCLMKQENLPEKYKESGKPVPSAAPVVGGGGSGTDEDATPAPSSPSNTATPLLGAESGRSSDSSSCADFPAKAIVVGFFPGMVAGVALLLLWTRLVEARTRRRSIKSFGAFTNFPSEANLTEKASSVTKKPSFPIGFVVQPPTMQQPSGSSNNGNGSNNKMTYSPMSASFRSPNLGPIIFPLSPPSHAATPNTEHFTRLAPRPASRERSDREHDQNRDSYAVSAISIAYSDSALPPPAPLHVVHARHPKRHSAETGYSASVYNDGNESRPFVLDTRNEVAIPPIPKPAPLFYRKFGGPMPRPPVVGWEGGRV